MSDIATQSWLKFLNPDSLKQNLIRSSLYLTCWEMLKECIVEQPRDFYTHDWENGEPVPGPNYSKEVLSLHKDPLIASALWFQEHNAISKGDIDLLLQLRTHRNEIAHELPKFLGTIEAGINLDFLNKIFYLVQKIDKWWIQQIEIPINPEFDDRVFTAKELDDVQSARMIFMSLLVAVANGNEDLLRSIYEQVKAEAQIRGWI